MGELFNFIFSLENATGRSIVWIICGFFAIGVANYLFQIAWIGWQWENLRRVQTYFKRNHGFGDISQWLTSLKDAKVKPRSIIYRRIEALLQMRDSGGQVDNDALADILTGKESRRASLANHILGILIILGLVGTLWGLITALIEVRPIVTGIEDFEELAEISKTLELIVGGMSTAFVTTITGLLTSLGLGLVGLVFNRVQSFFRTALEEFVSTAILPRFTQTPEASIDSAVKQLAECTEMLKFTTDENVAAMQNAIQEFMRTSSGGYLEQQQILAFKFDETAENLLKSLAGINEYQVVITSAIDSFKDMTAQSRAEIGGYQDAMNRVMEESVPQLKDESAALQEAIHAYQASQSELIDKFSTALQTQIQTVSERQQDTVRALMQLVAEEREASQAALREYQDSQSEYLKNLSDALLAEMQDITGQQQNVIHVLTQLTDNLMQLVTEEREASQAALREYQASQSEYLENLSDALLAEMRNITGQQQNVVHVLMQSVTEEREASQAAMREYSDALLAEIRDITGQQQNVVHVLTQLADELKIRPAIEAQNQAFKRIEEQLDINGQQLGTSFQSSEAIQRDILRAIQQLAGEFQIGAALDVQNQLLQRIAEELQIGAALDAQNQLFRHLANELQIRPALETQNRVLQGIESHLVESGGLTHEQNQLLRDLVKNMQQLLQQAAQGAGGSRVSGDLQPEVMNVLREISQKLDGLQSIARQTWVARWNAAIHRWLRGEK